MRRSVGAAAPPVHAQGFDSSAGQQLDSSTARRINSSPGRKSRFFVPASQPSLFGRCAPATFLFPSSESVSPWSQVWRDRQKLGRNSAAASHVPVASSGLPAIQWAGIQPQQLVHRATTQKSGDQRHDADPAPNADRSRQRKRDQRHSYDDAKYAIPGSNVAVHRNPRVRNAERSFSVFVGSAL